MSPADVTGLAACVLWLGFLWWHVYDIGRRDGWGRLRTPRRRKLKGSL